MDLLQLPTVILYSIFSFLNFNSLVILKRTCSSFNDLIHLSKQKLVQLACIFLLMICPWFSNSYLTFKFLVDFVKIKMELLDKYCSICLAKPDQKVSTIYSIYSIYYILNKFFKTYSSIFIIYRELQKSNAITPFARSAWSSGSNSKNKRIRKLHAQCVGLLFRYKIVEFWQWMKVCYYLLNYLWLFNLVYLLK